MLNLKSTAMKYIYTLFVLVVNLVPITVLSQQYNNLIYTLPDETKVPIYLSPSEFGVGAGDPRSAQIVAVDDDGCEPITQDIDGAIALIDRGHCSFIDKAQYAKEAGAAIVIICNNVVNGGSFNMSGSVADMWIPVLMASYEDCESIKLILDEPTIGTLIYANVDFEPYWVSGAPNYNTPLSQVDEIAFLAGIVNESNDTVNDIRYKVEITKDNEVVHSESSDQFGPFVSEEFVRSNLIEDVWTMTPELGVYDLTYTLISSSIVDVDTNKNSVSKKFKVSNSTFSKLPSEEEVGYEYLHNLQGYTKSLSYANGYYISNGDGWRPQKLITGFGHDLYTELGSTVLRAEVREWQVDIDGDFEVDIETETQLIATGELFLDVENQIDLRKLEIDLLPYQNLGFASSGQYLAIIHIEPLIEPTESKLMFPLAAQFKEEMNYSYAATTYAFQNYGLSEFGKPATMEDPFNKNEFVGLFLNTLTYFLSMEITDELVSSSDDFTEEKSLLLYPNPASNNLYLSMNLQNLPKEVTIEILDTQGNRIKKINRQLLNNEVTLIPIEEIQSGVYFVSVESDNEVYFEKVVVRH